MEEPTTYEFLQALLHREISLSGLEPPIAEVLKNGVQFEMIPAQQRFGISLADKFISALAKLRKNQRFLMGLPNGPKLRDYELIRKWMSNIMSAEGYLQEEYFLSHSPRS